MKKVAGLEIFLDSISDDRKLEIKNREYRIEEKNPIIRFYTAVEAIAETIASQPIAKERDDILFLRAALRIAEVSGSLNLYEKVLSKDDDPCSTLYNARILEQNGDYNKALDLYQPLFVC